jgi:hypothetical protein
MRHRFIPRSWRQPRPIRLSRLHHPPHLIIHLQNHPLRPILPILLLILALQNCANAQVSSSLWKAKLEKLANQDMWNLITCTTKMHNMQVLMHYRGSTSSISNASKRQPPGKGPGGGKPRHYISLLHLPLLGN